MGFQAVFVTSRAVPAVLTAAIRARRTVIASDRNRFVHAVPAHKYKINLAHLDVAGRVKLK
jgi:hypothetical protein